MEQVGEETGCCSETIDEDTMSDYEDRAEITAYGKYRCRDCGKRFDTLEEHDEHYRRVHSHMQVGLLQGMSM